MDKPKVSDAKSKMNGVKPLYKPFVSKAKNKKFSVYVLKDGKRKLIHFGDNRYEDFTQHKDEKRRQSYLKRAKGIKNKKWFKKEFVMPFETNTVLSVPIPLTKLPSGPRIRTFAFDIWKGCPL